MLSLELLAIDQGECQPVGDDWAKLFHQVERQRRPARAERMKKPYLRIQANAFEAGATFAAQQRIQKRKHGVDPVARRAAGATIHRELVLVGPHVVAKNSEVGSCRVTLGAAQFIQRAARAKLC